MLRARRKGLTFLETVAAAAILGMLAAVVFGGFGSMMASQQRQTHRLACAELANRLILQYLDSREELPPEQVPIAYGGDLFRWELRETPVQLVPARAEVAAARSSSSAFTVDRIVHVSVRVWLAEDSGGALEPDGVVPEASMGRMIDPIALRNPDSIENLFSDANSSRFKRFMDDLSRVSTGGMRRNTPATPAGGNRSSGQPAPPKPGGATGQ